MKYIHPHYIALAITKFQVKFWNVVNAVSARYWRISLKGGYRFMGRTHWYNMPDSKMEIARGCVFNSSHKSNLIGVYSPCMFSTIKRGAEVKIGTNCGFSGTVIAAAKSITLGNNVRCGANTLITDTDWHADDTRTSADAEIVIGDNVWLGYGVKVLKGVHIGDNSLIGAGAIVTHDIPANVIAAGNPCKVIRNL